MKITISAPSGLEGVVKKELYNLTKIEANSYNGKLTFDGDIYLVAKLNLYMRTASRVYINLGGFKADNFDELFDNVLNIDFENYLDKDSKITVNASIFESKLNSLQAVSSVCKKAIFSRLKNAYGTQNNESGFNHKIEISIRRDYVTLYLNTSGESLHKRGYRKAYGEAPIKETVASSLLNLSYFKNGKSLLDPFCGRGTIAIEAGMALKNIPAGILRDFDFLHFDKFNTAFFKDMLSEAKKNIINDVGVKIYASDIDEKQVEIAKSNARRAGVLDVIDFKVKDATTYDNFNNIDVIVTNPPYGERLLKRSEIVSLYREFGKTVKRYNGSLFIITPVTDLERLISKKADKKRKIYNGKLECAYYSFFSKRSEKSR